MATIIGSNGTDTLKGTQYDDTITGLAGNDQLHGVEGNDSIDGGSGLDTMLGGIGNDTYMVDSAGDLVIDGKDEGSDVVFSTISYTLAANIEDLWLRDTATAISGTGNDLDNLDLRQYAQQYAFGRRRRRPPVRRGRAGHPARRPGERQSDRRERR
jgi:Ca2+-binding RTX toxin-like protein